MGAIHTPLPLKEFRVALKTVIGVCGVGRTMTVCVRRSRPKDRREEVTDDAGSIQVREVREDFSHRQDVLRGPHAEGQLTFVTGRPARGLALLGEPVPARPLDASQEGSVRSSTGGGRHSP